MTTAREALEAFRPARARRPYDAPRQPRLFGTAGLTIFLTDLFEQVGKDEARRGPPPQRGGLGAVPGGTAA